MDYHNQSLKINRGIGDSSGEAVTLINIGDIYQAFGNYEEALNHYNQALNIYKENGEINGEATSLHGKGLCILIEVNISMPYTTLINR